MRYRVGDTPDAAAVSLDQRAFTTTAVLNLLIGIDFIFAGLRSRHYWITIWGSGLALSSTGYLIFLYITT